MPKLKNVSTVRFVVGPGDLARTGPEPWLPTGVSWSIAPNEEKVIFEDDYQHSRGLQEGVLEGTLTVLDSSEPVEDSRIGGGGSGVTTVKVTKTYADFSAAALVNTINIAVLPAGSYVLAVKVKHSVSFTGGAVTSSDIQVGEDFSGGLNSLGSSIDLTAIAPSATQQTAATTTTALNTESSTQITATLTTFGDNIDQLVAGSIDIWLTYVIQI